jgi:hypothetical protein
MVSGVRSRRAKGGIASRSHLVEIVLSLLVVTVRLHRVGTVRSLPVAMVSVVRSHSVKVAASVVRLHLVGIVLSRLVAMVSAVRLRRAKVATASRSARAVLPLEASRMRLVRSPVLAVLRMAPSRLDPVERSSVDRALAATVRERRVASAVRVHSRHVAAPAMVPVVAALRSVVRNNEETMNTAKAASVAFAVSVGYRLSRMVFAAAQ